MVPPEKQELCGKMSKIISDYFKWRREDPWGLIALERRRSRHLILTWFLLSIPPLVLAVAYNSFFLAFNFCLLVIFIFAVVKEHAANSKSGEK